MRGMEAGLAGDSRALPSGQGASARATGGSRVERARGVAEGAIDPCGADGSFKAGANRLRVGLEALDSLHHP